jgi:LPXTG-motif cell wall-anchored protein
VTATASGTGIGADYVPIFDGLAVLGSWNTGGPGAVALNPPEPTGVVSASSPSGGDGPVQFGLSVATVTRTDDGLEAFSSTSDVRVAIGNVSVVTADSIQRTTSATVGAVPVSTPTVTGITSMGIPRGAPGPYSLVADATVIADLLANTGVASDFATLVAQASSASYTGSVAAFVFAAPSTGSVQVSFGVNITATFEFGVGGVDGTLELRLLGNDNAVSGLAGALFVASTAVVPPTAATASGSIEITKNVLASSLLDADLFDGIVYSVEVSCATGPGTLVDGFPTVVELADGESVSLSVPAQAVCAAVEIDDGGATRVDVSPSAGVTIEEGQTSQVRVINSYDAQDLTIIKDLEGSGDRFDAITGDTIFTFAVRCTWRQYLVFDGELEVSADVPASTPLLPVGSECTVTEIDDGGADFTPDPITMIVDNSDNFIARFTNVFTDTTTGTIEVEKIAIAERFEVPWPIGPFVIEVSCADDTGSSVAGFPVSLEFAGEGTQTLEAPAGSTCSALETDLGGAHEVSYPDGSAVVEAGGQVGLAVRNEFFSGTLQIDKTVAGSGQRFDSILAGTDFEFVALCSWNGAQFAIERTVRIDGSTTASAFVELPFGAECTVSEVDSVGADQVPAPVTLVVDGLDNDVAAFFNTYTDEPPPPSEPPPASEPPPPTTTPPVPVDPTQSVNPAAPAAPPAPAAPAAPVSPAPPGGPAVPQPSLDVQLPATGASTTATALLATVVLLLGAGCVLLARRVQVRPGS